MPRKNGQARVLKKGDVDNLFFEIAKRRHPEKNRAIMQISFKLGLRVQEISLLEFKEVCILNGKPGEEDREFVINQVLALPASYTKGANATLKKRAVSTYNRKSISFSIQDFDRVINIVEKLARSGASVEPSDFYPKMKSHKGRSRELPIKDAELIDAINEHIKLRLKNDKIGDISPSSPLFITQKGVSYSANTLQEHMAMMLRVWAGVEKASSHSGRRTILTDIIHAQKRPVSVAQKVAGHASPSTTFIYAEATEVDVASALDDLSYSENKVK